MDELVIRSHRGSYSVRFGQALEGLESGLASNQHLIVDAKVAELHSEVLAPALAGRSVLRIEATEANKSLEGLPVYVNHLLERDIRREDLLIAVGGGIIQDITAFIAGTLFRGLQWRFYPTTLLAQADSCIGSKSSLNVNQYKNLVGTFTPPHDILISTGVLSTLDELSLRSGLGEMIKAHIISGWDDTRAIAAHYPMILQDKNLMAHYIYHSLEIKKVLIEVDEFDRKERLVMNYGHSFGHAIESATDYAVPHGIAVTIGMDMANYLSERLGMIDKAVYEELHPFLASNYAGFDEIFIPEDRFFAALTKDKKNIDCHLSLVLMRGPGQVFLDAYPNNRELHELCKEYLRCLPIMKRARACSSL